MDSLTHIVLGACIGEALLKKAGKKALLIGAVAQIIPDLDVLASLWLPQSDNLLAHRGITHSFIFILPAALLLVLITKKLFRLKDISVLKLLIFFSLQMLIHDLIDTCNAYGTGLLEPFNHHRFSIHLLYVADPFFTLPIIIAFIAFCIKKKPYTHRIKWLGIAFIPAVLYLSYAVINKAAIDKVVKEELVKNNIPHKDITITPTPFNTWLWFIVAASDKGYYVGHRSIFDKRSISGQLTYFPKNEKLLKGIVKSKEVEKLFKFADGNYTIELKNDSLVMNVLRFGQIAGWQNPRAPFVFQYVLNNPENDYFVMQRGRFKGWNSASFKRLWERMKGDK